MSASVGRRGVLAAAGLWPALAARGLWAGEGPRLHEVAMAGLEFDPPFVQVRVGDSLRWTNADFVPHTATAADQSWTTGKIEGGDSATIEVTEGMVGAYFCTFHPHMTGRFEITG